MSVTVRFAPSPTGYLHIGGARTALFNWLFARRQQGKLILRIEDTDVERSSAEMVEGILEGLTWLGLKWDEGPYYQSERGDLYRESGRRLLTAGRAYRCFCTPEELERRKKEVQSSGRALRCFGACRDLDPEAAERRERQAEPFALRFKVPEGRRIRFSDQVYDSVEVETSRLEDFVIQRSDGSPTYHLSVVTDDSSMEITHVIRGVDHLLNTTKHVLLFEALGRPLPRFAHLPLILGPDRKRLSKRHGATSVLAYRDEGFLPQPLRNYLALLGWSAGDDREVLTDEELIDNFSLERINKANAIFDVQKLEWLNGQYISHAPASQLATLVRELLENEGIWDECRASEDTEWFHGILDLFKSRIRKVPDFVEQARFLLIDSFEYEPEAVEKHLSGSPEETLQLRQALEDLRERYRNLEPFDLEGTEHVLRGLAKERGLKAGRLIGAVRVAVTGRTAAPGIFDVLVGLGKERTLERVDRVLHLLS